MSDVLDSGDSNAISRLVVNLSVYETMLIRTTTNIHISRTIEEMTQLIKLMKFSIMNLPQYMNSKKKRVK